MSVSILIPILAGIVTASIVNYLADVLPHTLRLTRPTCPDPQCGAVFSWGNYLLLRDCSQCGKRSRLRPIAIYLAAIAAAVYLWLNPPEKIGFSLGLLAFAYLGLVALIDLEHHLILLPLTLAGLLIAAGTGILMHGWLATLFGGLVGFGILYAFYLFGKVFTRMRARRLGQDPKEVDEALASGDVTVATILGLFLGWPLIWFGLLLGALLAGIASIIIIAAAVIQKRYKEKALMIFIPLGPAFITGALFLVYFPNWIVALLP
jgi:prepilin signal peptidase PulO-like enzyme (type II secretory pathway)